MSSPWGPVMECTDGVVFCPREKPLDGDISQQHIYAYTSYWTKLDLISINRQTGIQARIDPFIRAF